MPNPAILTATPSRTAQLEEQRHQIQGFLPTSDLSHDWAFPDGDSVPCFRGETFEKLNVLQSGASSYINSVPILMLL